MGRLGYLVRKEFLQIRRDRAMLRIIFAVPLLQLVVLGYAANLDLENVPVAILDQDRSAASRQLVEAVLQSQPFVAATRSPRSPGPAGRPGPGSGRRHTVDPPRLRGRPGGRTAGRPWDWPSMGPTARPAARRPATWPASSRPQAGV